MIVLNEREQNIVNAVAKGVYHPEEAEAAAIRKLELNNIIRVIRDEQGDAVIVRANSNTCMYVK